MIGWHHRLNGHKFEQVLGDGASSGRLSKLWEIEQALGAWRAVESQRVGHELAIEQQKRAQHLRLNLNLAQSEMRLQGRKDCPVCLTYDTR